MSAHLTTFYSFKGGVGRTLALINVGAALARRGHRTLLWDLDLEAPGLHLVPELSVPSARRGFLEWLEDLGPTVGGLDEAARRSLRGLTQPVPAVERLSVLRAFGALPDGTSADFAQIYGRIPWRTLFEDHPERGLQLLRDASAALAVDYEHILIDARTGLTDVGGLLIALLPHLTVLVGGYGHQNVRGLQAVRRGLQRFIDGRVAARPDPHAELAVEHVISPVPTDTPDAAARRRVWSDTFRGVEPVEIPFEGGLLFEERLAVLRANPEDPLRAAYERVADRVVRRRGEMLAHEAEASGAARRHGVETPPQARAARGLRFEDRVARILQLLRYDVEREQLLGGNRVDLVATRKEGLKRECWWVECKDHQAPIGKEVLETLASWVGGTTARSAGAGGLVVARRFTPAALAFAHDHPELLARTTEELEAELFDVAAYLHPVRAAWEADRVSGWWIPSRLLREDQPDPQGTPLLEHALRWAGGQGRPLWLVLGDFGTGKTTFAKRFAAELARRHLEDHEQPFPVHIDLKELPNATSLTTLLYEHLQRRGVKGSPEALLHLLNVGRAVLLLDAFDEMGVAAAGRSAEEQFRELAAAAGRASEARGNRVLITCRTHFFRDQQQVKDTAAGVPEGMEAPSDSPLGQVARRFDAQIDEILLFDDAEIQAYLRARLGAREGEDAWRDIQAIYDLKSLAPRPVLLDMIVSSLPKLAAVGGGVTPAGLYEVYTRQWLEDRAGGSLQTRQVQRHRLLSLLAETLWDRDERGIHHRDLLDEVRRHEASFPGLDYERVDLELRTAAFLVRSAEGYYRFAHKSFLEYFLAVRVRDALRAKHVEALGTAPLTPAVLGFLRDLAPGKVAVAVAEAALKGQYTERVSENALRVVRALGGDCRKANLPGAELDEEDLTESDLSDANLEGASLILARLARARLVGARMTRVDLRGADVTGADLSRADLREARLTVQARGASFHQADLRAVAGVDLRAVEARFTEARLDGAELHGADLRRAVLAGASLERTSLRAARLAEVDGTGAKGAPILDGTTAPRAWGVAWLEAIACLPTELRPRIPLPLGTVSGIAFWPGSTGPERPLLVLTGSERGPARLWDVGSGRELRRFGEADSINDVRRVSSVAFSKDGTRVIGGGLNGAWVWDVRSGMELMRLDDTPSGSKPLRGQVWTSFVVLSGRERAIAVDEGGMIVDLARRKALTQLDSRHLCCVAFAPAVGRVVTGDGAGMARLWDLATGSPLGYQSMGFEQGVDSVAVSPDGERVLSARPPEVWLWGRGIGRKRLGEHGQFSGVLGFSPDGTRILTSGDDRIVYVCDATTGEEVLALRSNTRRAWSATVALANLPEGSAIPLQPDTYPTTCAAFTSDGTGIATGATDEVARVCDAISGLHIRDLEGWGGAAISALAVSPDSVWFMAGGRGDGIAVRWSFNGRRLAGLAHGGYWRPPRAVAISHDGKQVLTGDNDLVRLWSTRTGDELFRFGASGKSSHGGSVFSVTLSPDGRRALSGANDGCAVLWDATTGAELHRFASHRHRVWMVAFTLDGQQALTLGQDGTLRAWNVATGKERSVLLKDLGDIEAGALSADRSHLLATNERGSHLWNVSTGQCLTSLASGTRSLTFSPDTQRLVVSDPLGPVLVHDFTGRELLRLTGHRGPVNAAAFTPDGTCLLTGGDDGTVRLWDALTGEALRCYWNTGPDWLSLDLRTGRHRGSERALEELHYVDPEEVAVFPRVWLAADLPHLRDEDEPGDSPA